MSLQLIGEASFARGAFLRSIISTLLTLGAFTALPTAGYAYPAPADFNETFLDTIDRTPQSLNPASIDAIAARSKKLEKQTRDEAERIVTRLNHARELLGSYYRKSVVKSGEWVPELEYFVEDWVKRKLKPKYKGVSKKVARTIVEESNRYGFDPVFLLAVIENESNFDPEAVGGVGEIGLMQLTPTTGEWMAKLKKIKFRGKKTLRDPVLNIQLGAFYLAQLRERFDFHSRLYLAAYNMGSTNVSRALRKDIWPKDYASRVMTRYVRFYTELKEDLRKTLAN